MIGIRPHKTRLDWFVWPNHPKDWGATVKDVPGWQFDRGSLLFHRTHIPLLPPAERDFLLTQDDSVQIEAPLLRPYQLEDVSRLWNRGGAFLAYEMRMGKTACACHLHDPSKGTLIVVGPLAAREAWKEWIMRTWNFPPALLAGKKFVDPMPGFPAYFIHYDVLEAHSWYLKHEPIATLVIDEAHMIQARGTKRLSAIAGLSVHAKRVYALSGTPMWNKPRSMYTLLHTIAPGAWGTHFEFCGRYADARPGAFGYNYDGLSNAEELQARIAMLMVRRTWQDTIKDLPPTTRVIEPVELSGTEYAAIEAATTKALLAKGGATTTVGYLAALRKRLAMVKIKPAVAEALQAARDGHKVVLWTWHNEVAEKTLKALGGDFPAWRLSAEDDQNKRDLIVRGFREVEGPAFLVASMGVGGVSLDFACSNYAIFLEIDWTPANVYQAEMRTFHISRPHRVTYFHTDDPIEMRLISALNIKNNFAGALGLSAKDITEIVLP